MPRRLSFDAPARTPDLSHLRTLYLSSDSPGPGCGKAGFGSRSTARRHLRRWHRRDRMRPYWCTDCRGWHLGHLPELVRAGVVTAAEWYGQHGNPPYQLVLTGCLQLLRGHGARRPAFERGRDQYWQVSDGTDCSGWHDDPVTATEHLLYAMCRYTVQDMAA